MIKERFRKEIEGELVISLLCTECLHTWSIWGEALLQATLEGPCQNCLAQERVREAACLCTGCREKRRERERRGF
jgi:hypothetical protein